MQSASAGFAAAVQSNSYETDHRVTLIPAASSPISGAIPTDWTEAIEFLSIDESITTDMPDGTRLITGYPARAAGITLAYHKSFNPRTPTLTAGYYIDPYNPSSPAYRYDLLGWGVKIEFGVIPHGGVTPEFITKFTGVIDSVDADPVAGTIQISCLDNRGKLSSAPSFPPIAGPQSPVELSTLLGTSNNRRWAPGNGLTCVYPIYDILNRAGINSIPPRFSNIWFGASMQGAGDADVAPLNSWHRAVPNLLIEIDSTDYRDWVEGKYGPQVPPSSAWEFTNFGGNNNNIAIGQGMEIEWFQSVTNQPIVPGATNPPDFPGTLLTMVSTIGAAAYAICIAQTAANTLQAYVVAESAGGTGVWNAIGPAVTGSGGEWHRFYFKFATTSASNVQVDLTLDSTHYVINVSDGVWTFTPQVLDDITWTADVPVEALQIGFPVGITSLPASAPDYSNFVPGAVLDSSMQNLTSLVSVAGQDDWNVLQQIAASEGMYAGFDETGVFRSKNRHTLATQNSVRSITSKTSLKAVSNSYNGANVRNRVRIPGDNFTELSRETVVWTLEQPLFVPARNTFTALINVDGVIAMGAGAFTAGVPASLYPASTTGTIAYSGFFATSQFNDGTGDPSYINPTGLTVTATLIDVDTFKLVVKNQSALGVWFVVPNSLANADFAAGTPSIWQVGVKTVISGGVGGTLFAETTDPVSIALRGEQYLELSSNPWFQTQEHCQDYCDDMVVDMSEPRPILQNVAWVPDPRLQLTDRITLVDPEVSQLQEDCLIIGMNWSMANGQWDCTADLRTYASPGSWLLGVVGRSEMSVATYV